MWLLEQRAYHLMQKQTANAVGITEFHTNDDILSVQGKTATIQINGILTEQADFFATLFGA